MPSATSSKEKRSHGFYEIEEMLVYNIHRIFGRSLRCSRYSESPFRYPVGHQATAAALDVDRNLLQFSRPSCGLERLLSILFRPRVHSASSSHPPLASFGTWQRARFAKHRPGQSCELRRYHDLLPSASSGRASEQSALQFTRSSRVNDASSMTVAIKCQSFDGALICWPSSMRAFDFQSVTVRPH